MLNIALTKIECSGVVCEKWENNPFFTGLIKKAIQHNHQKNFSERLPVFIQKDYTKNTADYIEKYIALTEKIEYENLLNHNSAKNHLKNILSQIIKRLENNHKICQSIPKTEKEAEEYIRKNIEVFYALFCDIDNYDYFKIICNYVHHHNINDSIELKNLKAELLKSHYQKDDFEYLFQGNYGIKKIISGLFNVNSKKHQTNFLKFRHLYIFKNNIEQYPEYKILEEKLNILENLYAPAIGRVYQGVENLIDQNINQKEKIQNQIKKLLNNSYSHFSNRQKLLDLRDKNITKYKKQLVKLNSEIQEYQEYYKQFEADRLNFIAKQNKHKPKYKNILTPQEARDLTNSN